MPAQKRAWILQDQFAYVAPGMVENTAISGQQNTKGISGSTPAGQLEDPPVALKWVPLLARHASDLSLEMLHVS